MPLFATNEKVPADKLNAMSGAKAIRNALGAMTNNTTANFQNLAGTSSLSFTKRRSASETNLKVFMVIGCRASGGIPMAIEIGVLINGTDYQLGHKELNASVNEHEHVVGADILTGIAAGTYTVQGRIWRISGTNFSIDSNDWISLIVEEVAA